MRQKHRDCRNCCVLIRSENLLQCGIVFACGDRFCYVLTTKIDTIVDVVVTFADEVERSFSASNVVLHKNKKLSILVIQEGNVTIKAMQSVEFGTQDDIQNTVVYTLSYIPRASDSLGVSLTRGSKANTFFRGGNLG